MRDTGGMDTQARMKNLKSNSSNKKALFKTSSPELKVSYEWRSKSLAIVTYNKQLTK